MSEPVTLTCPSCGSENVGSNDDVACRANGEWIIDEDGERVFEPEGYTEVFWDSQTTHESEPCLCPCGWQGAPEDLRVPVRM